jgi:hypothetical protein
LREALARSDNDFLVAEPRRKKPAPRKSAFSTLFAVGRFFRGVATYPNRIAGALLVAFAIAITVNALELQTARHPAPLFGRAMLPPASIPAPQPATANMTRAPVPPARMAAPAPVAAATRAFGDPLGQFIRHDDATSQRQTTTPEPVARPDSISQIIKETAPAAAAAAQQPSRTVLAVQRALVKLGFVLRADGIDGEATRKVITQYEADHHLPAHGELSPKVIRDLSVESNIAIP